MKLSMKMPWWVLCTCWLASSPACATAYFPDGEWRTSTPEAQGIDSSALRDILRDLDTRNQPIYSVLVIRNGYLVLESYRHPFRREIPVETFSVTKSVLSALVGIAIGEGYIKNVEQPMLSYFPDRAVANPDPRKARMRVADLLTMSSGFDWDRAVDPLRMTQTPDWVGYALDRPMSDNPGEKFNYAEAAPHLLSAIIQRSTGQTAAVYGESRLFAPLGMRVKWFPDPAGISRGGMGIMTRPLDLARLGYLYLNDGRWGQRQVLPPGWVKASTAPHVSTQREDPPNYGYLWWLPSFGGFTAVGSGGHYVYANPQKNLLVVITAGMDSADNLPLVKRLLGTVRQDAPLPERPTEQAALTQAAAMMEEPPLVAPALPARAAAISGQVFELVDEQSGRSESFSICFPAGKAEAELNCHDASIATPVGLDGRYRQGSRRQSRGRWISPDEFHIEHINRVNQHEEVRLRFDERRLYLTQVQTAGRRERRSATRPE